MKKLALVLLASGLVASQIEASDNNSGSINSTTVQHLNAIQGNALKLLSTSEPKDQAKLVSNISQHLTKLKKQNPGLAGSMKATQQIIRAKRTHPAKAVPATKVKAAVKEVRAKKAKLLPLEPSIVTE